MKIGIVTDSTCDLPRSIISALNITVIPVYINLDGHSFLDQIELSRKDFYERLPKCKLPATTSAPGIGTFIKVYKRLAGEGVDHILSVHIHEGLSNIINVARLAAEATKSISVDVIDSGNLTIGTGLVARAAASAARAGNSINEVIEHAQRTVKSAYAYAVLDTLEYLKIGGRLSNLKYNLGTMLDIKPIMKMHDGDVDMDMVRTWRKGKQKIFELLSELGTISQLAIVHANAQQKAEQLFTDAASIIDPTKILMGGDVSPAIGVHVGPGALCFVGIKE